MKEDNNNRQKKPRATILIFPHSYYYIVTTDELAAKDAVNYLKINKFGRATFFPINIIKEGYIDNETLRILRLENDFIDVASNLVRYESTYDRIIKILCKGSCTLNTVR